MSRLSRRHSSLPRLSQAATPQITILYDGGCPLCLREARFLQQRNRGLGCMAFRGINDSSYSSADNEGVDYRQERATVHAI